ncbi:MAG: hypothetical protein WCL23_02240 [Candidatus Moraniibacteriota bacterium]
MEEEERIAAITGDHIACERYDEKTAVRSKSKNDVKLRSKGWFFADEIERQRNTIMRSPDYVTRWGGESGLGRWHNED